MSRKHTICTAFLAALLGISASCGSSIKNAQEFAPNKAPQATTFTVEYIGADSAYKASKLYAGMPFSIIVEASDPENKKLTYSITSDQGTFSSLTESESGVSCKFYIGTIAPGDPVRISLTVTDPKNASFSQTIDVGSGKKGPGLTVVPPTSTVIIPDDSVNMTVSCDSKGVFCVYRSKTAISKDQAVLGTSVTLYDNENEKISVPILGPSSTQSGSVKLADDESNYVWVVFRDNNSMTDSYFFPMTVDSVSPIIVSTYPADNSENISRKPNIQILFNKALNPSTVNISNITLSASDGTAVAGTVNYDSTEHIVTFIPGSELLNNVKYTVKVSTAVTDTVIPTGNPLIADCVFSFTVVPDGTLSAPEFFPVPGTYTGSRNITMTNSDPLATIIYTDDGITVPKVNQNSNGTYTVNNGKIYTGSVPVTAKTIIRALTYKDGAVASGYSTAVYNIKPQPPVFTETEKDSVTGALTLSISSASGSSIYYSTDGSNPSSSGKLLGTGQTISVKKSMTVRAVAKQDGLSDSDQKNADYTVRAATPVFSIPSGSYETDQYLFISSDSGTTIYYNMTTSGVEPENPTTNSEVFPLGKSLPGTTTGITYWIKTVANKEGELAQSSVSSVKITVSYGTTSDPVFSLSAGVYNSQQTLMITCPTPGATIDYTISGSNSKNTSKTAQTLPVTISISESMTVSAVSIKSPKLNSTAVSRVYTMKVPTPLIGRYYVSPTAYFSVTDPTASSIAYTTDGTTPQSSNAISGSVQSFTGVLGSVVKAIGCRAGWTNSDIATYHFPIVTFYENGKTYGTVPSSYTSPINATITFSNYDTQKSSLFMINSGGYSYKCIGWNTSSGSTTTISSLVVTDTDIYIYPVWQTLSVGDTGPANGKIFHIAASYNGWKYLEASTSTIGPYPWSSQITSIATTDSLGSGYSNTPLIVTADTAHTGAAYYCSSYSVTFNGTTFDDWYLPTVAELTTAYTNISTLSKSSVWTSMQTTTASDKAYYFSNGSAVDPINNSTCWKTSNSYYAIPVRRF